MGPPAAAGERASAVCGGADVPRRRSQRRRAAGRPRLAGPQHLERDILKLREEVHGLTVKSASHQNDIQKSIDTIGKVDHELGDQTRNILKLA